MFDLRNFLSLKFLTLSMKKIILLFSIVLILGCKSTKTEAPELTEIKRNLSYLASDDLAGRKTGSPGLEKAAVFIEDEFIWKEPTIS